MNEQELIQRMRNVKYYLENAKNNLKSASNILNSSITFDNEGFRQNDINTMNSKLNNQIYNIDNLIIPQLYSDM